MVMQNMQAIVASGWGQLNAAFCKRQVPAEHEPQTTHLAIESPAIDDRLLASSGDPRGPFHAAILV